MFRALLLASMLTAPAAGNAWSGEALPPASVAVAFDREAVQPVVVEGVADRTTGRPVAANDPVRIASISKLVMGLVALRLVDEGKVDLDADVSAYLGWTLRAPGFPRAPVTLRQLLSHRAGLRDRIDYVIPLGESLQARLTDPAAWYADAPPGEAPFEYANIGSPVVATVLEAASGERYDRLVERTVFAPLGIKACLNWIGCDDDLIARAVVLYRDNGEVARDDAGDLPPHCTIPVAAGVSCSLDGYVPGTNASIFSPQGGVRIGMLDLAKIGQALLAGPQGGFLSEYTYDEWLVSMGTRIEGQQFFCSYGLAVQLIEGGEEGCQDALFSDGAARIGHAGEAYGLRSGLWFDPQSGTGLAYFTTAVPPRQSAEDEGGFDPREIALVARAQKLVEELAEAR